MADEQKVGEVIEACTIDFVAQCYELYQSPPLGSLVKTCWEPDRFLYGVVYNVLTGGIEPGRRPIARGKNEEKEAEVYLSNPQLSKLLRSEFRALVVGYSQGDRIFQCLSPKPARIHGFVYPCSPEEVRQISRSFDFLNTLLKARLDISVEALTSATLREMSQFYGAEKHAFLISAGKELATLLSQDYGQLKAILKGLKYDAA
jgi:hypothetical protein